MQQAKDAEVILNKLERLSGTRGWQPVLKQTGSLLEQLAEMESMISDLSDSLHEWKEILPSVAKNVEDEDDFDETLEEIRWQAGEWWKHFICRREIRLKNLQSWVSCWNTFSQHWDNVTHEEWVCSRQYTAQHH